MPDANPISLVNMQAGQIGTVHSINGGHGMIDRLNMLGIFPGKRVTKLGSIFMRGPVTIEVDRAKVALGYGMAKRVLVQMTGRTKE